MSHQKPRQTQVLAMFASDPMRYVTRADVVAAIPGWTPDKTLDDMRRDGTLVVGPGVHCARYYLSAEAKLAGAEQVEIDRVANATHNRERRAAYERERSRVSPPRVRTKPAAKPGTRQSGSAQRPLPRPPRLVQCDPVIPPGLVVQHGPNYRGDTRYMVDGPIVGGFASEWATLRGQAA